MSMLRFSLTSADPVRLAAFYRDALGFEIAGEDRVSGIRFGVDGDVTTARLRLGAQTLEIVGFDPPGHPYPSDSTSHDGWFQHLALVASDIDAAYARLAAYPGWSPISRSAGPVQLPDSSGGVRAFKFRDPEGHPLELLAFPSGKVPSVWTEATGTTGPLVGIDHSAIVVGDVDRSITFYAALGFSISASSENTGPAQDALDGADGVSVSVRALSVNGSTPHLELLGYHNPSVRVGQASDGDVACTRTVLPGRPQQLVDPDGHVVLMTL